jgi:NitT/TauT family transport system permease protein
MMGMPQVEKLSNQVEKWTYRLPIEPGRLLNILSVIGGIVIWEIITRNLSGILLASPSAVVVSWLELVQSGELQQAFLGSIQHMMLGYVISFVVALPLAFAIAQSEIVRTAVNPYIDAIYSTPVIAYLPLIIAWWGLRFNARVFMVFMFCVFEMIIVFQDGVADIDEAFLDVGDSFDLTWLQFQRNVVFPASLPYIFGGLRLGIGRAVRGMIVAELFLAVVNIGDILIGSSATFSTSIQLAVVITISIFGVIVQSVVTFAERQAIPWYHTGEVEV